MGDTNLKYPGLTKKQRATMGFHGMLVIIIGATAGFAWLISIAGYLQFWPLPALDFTVPDEREAWRNAHMGPIVHGMLIILIASISSLLLLTKKESVIMVISSLVEVWGNVIGFQTAPFTSNRGLTPTGPFIDALSYGTFYIAVVAAFIILILSTIGLYRTMRAT